MQSDTFTRTGGDGKSVTVYRSLLGEERITAVTHLPSSTGGLLFIGKTFLVSSESLQWHATPSQRTHEYAVWLRFISITNILRILTTFFQCKAL